MEEMKAWNSLGEQHQEKVRAEAQKLLRWMIGLSDQVNAWDLVVEGRRVRGLAEESNQHLLDGIDATTMRSLSGLQRAGISRPLVPLYVAVWELAMEIEQGEIEPQQELAITLAMVRVQGTARLVHEYNQAPGDAILGAELKRRGLIRR